MIHEGEDAQFQTGLMVGRRYLRCIVGFRVLNLGEEGCLNLGIDRFVVLLILSLLLRITVVIEFCEIRQFLSNFRFYATDNIRYGVFFPDFFIKCVLLCFFFGCEK